MSTMRRVVTGKAQEACTDLPETELAGEIDSTDVLGLTASADAVGALRALVIGHKRAFIDEGFSEASAEEMAVVLHDSIAEDWFG